MLTEASVAGLMIMGFQLSGCCLEGRGERQFLDTGGAEALVWGITSQILFAFLSLVDISVFNFIVLLPAGQCTAALMNAIKKIKLSFARAFPHRALRTAIAIFVTAIAVGRCCQNSAAHSFSLFCNRGIDQHQNVVFLLR